ncbi:hypothetical protein MHU86_8789 [Fragilaria crotonensis]|nr:hypothetical protein MHU86_8789 [Fragilaria crotonensis]
MFQRFERLLPKLNSANQDDEVLDLIPNADQKRNIREQKQALADIKSVTIALQRMDIMSMKESDVLFRSIIDAYPDAYLGSDADIIHNKALERCLDDRYNGYCYYCYCILGAYDIVLLINILFLL